MKNEVTSRKSGTAGHNSYFVMDQFFSFMSAELVHVFAVQYVLQILPVLVLFHDFIDLEDCFSGDPSVQLGDFFQAGDLAVLMLLHGLDEVGGIHQAFVSPCIQPGKALS